jgi:uncharacterized membrane protein
MKGALNKRGIFSPSERKLLLYGLVSSVIVIILLAGIKIMIPENDRIEAFGYLLIAIVILIAICYAIKKKYYIGAVVTVKNTSLEVQARPPNINNSYSTLNNPLRNLGRKPT